MTLYELNTWPWLDAVSRRLGRLVTLASVPDAEWDALGARGFDFLYLMGVWSRSPLGRQIARTDANLFTAYDRGLPGWEPRDVVGSAFCLTGYKPDPRIGSRDDLARVRRALNARGMRLVLDFVPNHTAFDHPWLVAFPDRYVCGTEDAFRNDPRAFRRIDLPSGAVRLVACGRDPHLPPWTDVAQLNYNSPETRAAMIAELRRIGEIADGVRCDMAMLLLTDVFARTWAPFAGTPLPGEFWTEAVGAVPGLLLIAEVYWDLEHRLQELGFAFTYDKQLYDRLLHGSAADVSARLRADVEFQRRSVRFVENHDEPRSAAAFGDRVRAAALTTSTVPGMAFFHDGQLAGRQRQLPVQVGRAPDEPTDSLLAAFYDRLLAAIREPVFRDGRWRLLDVLPAGDGSHVDVLAWQWTLGAERRVIAVNLGQAAAQARLALGELESRDDRLVLEDLLDGREYPWLARDLVEQGLFVRLERGCGHLFRVH